MPLQLSAFSRLCLVRVKVYRAKKHLSDLERELIEYRNKDFTVFGSEFDANTGKELPGVERSIHNLPILPFDMVTAAGDVLYNLRSALDHLAYQLVLVGTKGKGTAHPERVQFPIAKDFATYESIKARQVEGMRIEAKLAIDNAKPYKGGNEALWRIHDLNRIDKHRALFTVAKDHLFAADWLPNGMPYWLKAEHLDFAGVFGNDAEKDIEAELDALGNPKVVQSNSLLPSLHQLVDFADGFISSFLSLLE